MADQDAGRADRRWITSWAAGCLLAGIAGTAAWLSSVPSWTVTADGVTDRVVVVGCATLALVAIGFGVRRRPKTLRRAAVVGAGAAVAGGLLAAAAIPPAPPRPGLPLLKSVVVDGQSVGVVVVPQRPGWNLIHVDAKRAAVGLDSAHLESATPRPGATGVWALVELPAGRSSLAVEMNGSTAAVPLNAGYAPSVLPGLTSQDGPECLSAALGALVAGQRGPLRQCPSAVLAPVQAAELRGMVNFIAGRGIRHVTLVQDASPRSVQAAQVVLAACEHDRIKVGRPGHHPGGPVIIVSGWTGASAALQQVVSNQLPSEGTYLAPWLLDGSLQGYSAGELLPLQFEPASVRADRYIAALGRNFPGEQPTESGYLAWLAAKRLSSAGPVHMFAASVVYDIGVDELGPQLTWIKDGTITQVSSVLDDR